MREKLSELLRVAKSQAVPLPRVAASLTAQTEVLEILAGMMLEQHDRLNAMQALLAQLGIDASAPAVEPKPYESDFGPDAEKPWVKFGEPVLTPAAPPEPAALPPRRAEQHSGVEFRQTQSTPGLGEPSFSANTRQQAPTDVYTRQSGQHEPTSPGLTNSEDLNQHGGLVSSGPSHPPPAAPQPPMQVYGPGAPGGGPSVSFRPAAPAEDANQNPAVPREPVVELRPSEPENRSDVTVAFSPAEPAIEATPLPRELTPEANKP